MTFYDWFGIVCWYLGWFGLGFAVALLILDWKRKRSFNRLIDKWREEDVRGREDKVKWEKE